MTENATENPDAATETAPPEPEAGKGTGFAVYDETELRFRGVVHPTKAEANKAKAELSKGKPRPGKAPHKFTVRAV